MSKQKYSGQVGPAVSNEEAKPLVLVGMESTPKGYVVVSAVVRGGKVERKEEHCPPQMKQWAARVLRRILQQKVLFPNGR